MGMQARLQRLRLKCRRKHGDIEVLGRALLVKHALPLLLWFWWGRCGKGEKCVSGSGWQRGRQSEGKVCVWVCVQGLKPHTLPSD